MNPRELDPGPLRAAADALLDLERRFGADRRIEGGLCRLRGFTMPEPTQVDDALTDWVSQVIGLPRLRPADRSRLDVRFAPVSLEALRAELLDDERFGDQSEDDTAWFDPTPQGDDGIAKRDEALRTFVELTEPLRFVRFLDEGKVGDRVPYSVLMLSSAVAGGVLFVAARVSLSSQMANYAPGAAQAKQWGRAPP
jgi:hypothetical protein